MDAVDITDIKITMPSMGITVIKDTANATVRKAVMDKRES
jgi:hypothetical protein